MTVSAIFGGTDWVEFATTRGTGNFMRWVESLDLEQFPLLSHLADWGWVNNLDALALEIPLAIAESSPEESVSQTLSTFRDALTDRPPSAESVMLTNGLSRIDDDEGEWWIGGVPVSDNLGNPLDAVESSEE